jgi:hypothetical protein
VARLHTLFRELLSFAALGGGALNCRRFLANGGAGFIASAEIVIFDTLEAPPQGEVRQNRRMRTPKNGRVAVTNVRRPI